MKDKSYGVTLQTVLNTEVDKHIEEIQITGFSLLEKVLTYVELSECRKKIDAVYKIQKERFGEDKLNLINEKNLARCLLAYDEYFLKIATNKKVLEIVESVLGNYYILHLQNGIINSANEEHHQSSWHRDLPYQNFVISKPIAINAMFCIDDFTIESGSTFVLPHSHRVESIPSEQYVNKHAVQLIAKAGSVVMFDSMLFHKAGYNSGNFTRRAINNVYVAPILKQQISLPDILQGKYSDDDFLAKFLGYHSSTPASDVDWRNKKLSKK